MDNLNFQPTCSQEPKYLKGFSAKTNGAQRPFKWWFTRNQHSLFWSYQKTTPPSTKNPYIAFLRVETSFKQFFVVEIGRISVEKIVFVDHADSNIVLYFL